MSDFHRVALMKIAGFWNSRIKNTYKKGTK